MQIKFPKIVRRAGSLNRYLGEITQNLHQVLRLPSPRNPCVALMCVGHAYSGSAPALLMPSNLSSCSIDIRQTAFSRSQNHAKSFLSFFFSIASLYCSMGQIQTFHSEWFSHQNILKRAFLQKILITYDSRKILKLWYETLFS